MTSTKRQHDLNPMAPGAVAWLSPRFDAENTAKDFTWLKTAQAVGGIRGDIMELSLIHHKKTTKTAVLWKMSRASIA